MKKLRRAASRPEVSSSLLYRRDLLVLPNDENEHIAVKRATLQRGLQPLSMTSTGIPNHIAVGSIVASGRT